MNAVKEINPHDTTLRMILMIAACFAIGSIGVLLAVLMQSSDTASSLKVENLVVSQQQQKTDAMQSLSISEQSTAVVKITASSSASTSRATVTTTHSASPTQADTKDTNAAAKLKILEALNSK